MLKVSGFDYNMSILILVYVVLGGIGNLRGSIIATVILYALPELLRGFANYRMLIYAVILVVVMIFKPTGLFGGREFSLYKLIEKITHKGNAAKPAIQENEG